MTKPFWDTLWLDAKLATFAGSAPYGAIENAALAVYEDKIVWIGQQSNLPAKPEQLAQQVFSANGRWITPGLIDCHTHLIYAGNRAQEFELRLQGASYAEIAQAGGGIRSTVAATRAADFLQLYQQSAKRLEFLLVEGVTTLEIKSGYGLDLETELKILQVAKKLEYDYPITIRSTFLGAHALPEEYAGKPDEYIDFVCNEVMPQIAKEKLADAVDVFCENIGFTLQQTETVFRRAKELDLAVKLHADQLSDGNGAALAAKYQALSADHIEYTSVAGVKAMAQAGTVAVLLPAAFYFLREKTLPPIELLRQHKVPIAIATDCNPGTSPTTSLLLMLNMACTLFRLTPEEALSGITKNAARALGLAETHGTLEVGKVADFIIWDIDHPAELAYAIGFNPCMGIVKAGTVIANNII